MAKCTGPLYSLSASGKIADAMVYFNWKGINVVREWLKPSNPQSLTQGDQRIMFGGTGRAVSEIRPHPGVPTVSKFAQQLIDLKLIPGGQTKQSYLVKYILNHYLTDATAYVAMLAECTGHISYTLFEAAADTLGVVVFDLDYATIEPYDKALGLYMIAKFASAIPLIGSPYDIALSTWTSTEIDEFISQFTTA